MSSPSQLGNTRASTTETSKAKRAHITQEAPSGTGVEVNTIG